MNDDYCDCLDGSDEPGTAACPNGRFFCANKFFLPLLLNASMVDDGVCGELLFVGCFFVHKPYMSVCCSSAHSGASTECPAAGEVGMSLLLARCTHAWWRVQPWLPIGHA